jgi:hypothetical protein
MERFVVTSLLLAAVTFAAAVEARDVATIDESSDKSPWISRKLLGVGGARPVDGTDQICDQVGILHGFFFFFLSRHVTYNSLFMDVRCFLMPLYSFPTTASGEVQGDVPESLTKLPGVTTPSALLQASVRVAIAKAKQGKWRVDAYAADYHGGNPWRRRSLIDGGRVTGADLNGKLSAVAPTGSTATTPSRRGRRSRRRSRERCATCTASWTTSSTSPTSSSGLPQLRDSTRSSRRVKRQGRCIDRYSAPEYIMNKARGKYVLLRSR